MVLTLAFLPDQPQAGQQLAQIISFLYPLTLIPLKRLLLTPQAEWGLALQALPQLWMSMAT
jgi:hypothetical protein